MLENFHSYAMALYRIECRGGGLEAAAGRLAEWLFDMGDGSRLLASESTVGVRVRRDRLG
jgi:hypothetical protein